MCISCFSIFSEDKTENYNQPDLSKIILFETIYRQTDFTKGSMSRYFGPIFKEASVCRIYKN